VITTTGDRLWVRSRRSKKTLTLETGYSDADFKLEGQVASIESTRQFWWRHSTASVWRVRSRTRRRRWSQVGDTTVKLADVSLVQPFERTFWARFDMGLTSATA
jgi:hypothetical protein